MKNLYLFLIIFTSALVLSSCQTPQETSTNQKFTDKGKKLIINKSWDNPEKINKLNGQKITVTRLSVHMSAQNTVSETADKLGFEYPQYFSRLFKKKVGMSPK